MVPLHEVRDHEKVERLAADMEENGWQGAPLVKWDPYRDLLTGTHRYAAARSLGWDDSEIPMIDIAEVFEEDGLNFEECLAEYNYPYLGDFDFEIVLQKLSYETTEKYGIQFR